MCDDETTRLRYLDISASTHIDQKEGTVDDNVLASWRLGLSIYEFPKTVSHEDFNCLPNHGRRISKIPRLCLL